MLLALALVADVAIPSSHRWIDLGERPPTAKVMLFASPKLEGEPALVIDGEGLHAQGELVCAWRSSDSTLLRSINGENCEGYPAGSSGDHVAIDVVRMKGDLIETRWGETPLYASLRALPPAKVQHSADEIAAGARRQERKLRKRDPAWGAFYDGVKACFAKPDSCEQFVTPDVAQMDDWLGEMKECWRGHFELETSTEVHLFDKGGGFCSLQKQPDGRWLVDDLSPE